MTQNIPLHLQAPFDIWEIEADQAHAAACLKAGGFPRAVRVGESVVSVYPLGPEPDEAQRIAAYLAGIKDRKPIYPDLSKRGTGRFR